MELLNKIDFVGLGNLIVVGCDGVGKTTLCKRLADEGKFEYRKASVADGADKIDLAKTEILRPHKKPVIFDRFYFPDDLIYSRIIDLHSNDLELEQWEEIIELINEGLFTVVYITDSYDNIKARFEARGDEYVNLEQVKKVIELYEKTIDQIKNKVDVFHVDLENNTYGYLKN